MTTTVSRHVSELVIQAKGVDTDGRKFNNALKEVEKQAVKTDSTMGKLGKTFTSFARTIKFTIVGAATAAAAGMARLGVVFQNAEKSIAVATGATGADLEELNDSLLEVYRTAREPVTAEGLASLIGTLNTLTGSRGVGLTDLTRQLSDMAGLLGENAEAIGTDFARAGNAFGETVQGMSEALDTVFTLIQDYGVSAGKLAADLREYGPVLKAMGLSFEESAVFIAKAYAEGVNMGRISPALNQALKKLSKEGITDTRTAFDELFTAMSEAGNEAEATRIGIGLLGSEGISRLSLLAQQGALDVDSFAEAVADSAGSIDTTVDATRTLSSEWDRLRRASASIAKDLSGPLTDALTGIVGYMADVAEQSSLTRNAIKTNFEQMGEATNGFAKGLTAIGDAFKEVFDIIIKKIEETEAKVAGANYLKEAAGLPEFLGFGTPDYGKVLKANITPGPPLNDNDPPLASDEDQGKIEETTDLYREMDETIRRMYDRQLAERRAFEESIQTGPREMDAAIRKFVELEQAGNEALRSIGDSMDRNLAAGMTDFVFSIDKAKQSFGAFALSFLEQTGRMITQMIILNAITGGGGGGFGALLGGGGGGGGLGSLFSGASSAGAGAINRGVSSAPTPNGGGGTVGAATVNVHNHAGAQVDVSSNGNVIDIAVRESVAAVRSEYARDMKRGQGAFAQGFEGGYKNRRRLG